MSIRLMAAVFDEELPATEKLVLLAMADHADDTGKNCFPSVSRLSRKASMTRRGVQKVIRRLEEKNKIRPVGRRADGTVEYAITLEGANGIRGGEHGSRGEGRTVFAGGANPVRVGGEHGSPETSRTIIEPSSKRERAAQTAAAFPSLPGFERFYEAYPRKMARIRAQRAWLKAKAERDVEAVLEGLAKWKQCAQWQDENYIPYPATFINEERWKTPPSVQGGLTYGGNHHAPRGATGNSGRQSGRQPDHDASDGL